MAVVGEAAALQDGVVQDRRPGLISGVGLRRGSKKGNASSFDFSGFLGSPTCCLNVRVCWSWVFQGKRAASHTNVLPGYTTCCLKDNVPLQKQRSASTIFVALRVALGTRSNVEVECKIEVE